MVATAEKPKTDLISDQQKVSEQIRELAIEIDARRARLDISQAKLCEKYIDLGSRRHFSRALNGEITDAKILVKYNTVRLLMELEGSIDDTEIYDDFNAFLVARNAFIEMARENGVRRFLPILGHSGAGKTTFSNWLVDRYPGRVIIVEAMASWRNCNKIGSGRSLCAAILGKLGHSHIPSRNFDLAQTTIELLNNRRICVVIEEAHEMCLDGLMMIKGFINQTQGEFVVTAHPKLWADLQKSSYSSCSQLTGNRLWEKVDFDLQPGDILTWLDRKMPSFTATGKKPVDECAREAADHVARLARPNGGWNFVRGMCEALKRSGHETLTLPIVIAAANKEAARR